VIKIPSKPLPMLYADEICEGEKFTREKRERKTCCIVTSNIFLPATD
jgi:hypothetical protein